MTREEAKDAIQRQGGKASGSVSGNTDYLIVGSDPGSTKTSDADEHDVKKIKEKQFLKMLNG
jgi:DNA ligase (NAD+)